MELSKIFIETLIGFASKPRCKSTSTISGKTRWGGGQGRGEKPPAVVPATSPQLQEFTRGNW